jgi:hypothetical protein
MNEKLKLIIKHERLRETCKANGRSLTVMLRVAGHLVYDEDILGLPPGESHPTLDAAKAVKRLERKIDDRT